MNTLFQDKEHNEIRFDREERIKGAGLSATVTWTGWRCREGERVRERGEGQSWLGRCDENRGMLLIMEKYPWLRGGKRGSQGWPAPPHLRSTVPSRCHGYCTPCILSVCHPPCRVLRSPQHSPPPSPLYRRLITPSATCWGSSDSMTS